MCLVYWPALVNMCSMLTGDMKVRNDSDSICGTELGISLFEQCVQMQLCFIADVILPQPTLYNMYKLWLGSRGFVFLATHLRTLVLR